MDAMFMTNKSGSKAAETVLVAGATGFLGSFAVRELASRGYSVKSLCRSTGRASDLSAHSEIVVGDVTSPETLRGQLDRVDSVICCLGSPMLEEDPSKVQRDGVINLFQEAVAAGVKHFVMVSVFNAENIKTFIAAARAKEEAVDFIIKNAESHDISYTIVRPTAFFKDMEEMFDRVIKTGKFTVIGSGEAQANPISGTDLAARLCDCLTNEDDKNTAFGVGGPEVFRIKELGEMIFQALGTEPKYSYVNPFLLSTIAGLFGVLSICASKLMRYAEAIKFVQYVCTCDNVADRCGQASLKDFFQQLAREHAEVATSLGSGSSNQLESAQQAKDK